MKLILSLLLSLLSGSHSASLSIKVVEEPPRPAIRDCVKSILHHSLVFGAELISYWESSEEDRNAALSKRMETIKTSYYNLGPGMAEYIEDIYKEVNKEINETYPVYNNNVIPIFAAFFVQGLQTVLSAAEEIKPYFEKYEEQVKAQQKVFWEEVRPIIQKAAKPVVDALNANLKPYIDVVRKEVANAQIKENNKSASEQDTKNSFQEYIKQSESLQKILFFDGEVLNTMVTNLEIFNTKA